MNALFLIVLPAVGYSLKCKDTIIGTTNGTTFNFDNTLRCPSSTKWCMNITIHYHSPKHSVDGNFGNCESNGLVGSLTNFTKPFVDISCKDVGCVIFPEVNVTRCCCNTDLCNAANRISILLLSFLLFQLVL